MPPAHTRLQSLSINADTGPRPAPIPAAGPDTRSEAARCGVKQYLERLANRVVVDDVSSSLQPRRSARRAYSSPRERRSESSVVISHNCADSICTILVISYEVVIEFKVTRSVSALIGETPSAGRIVSRCADSCE